ncbi:hypothetical protein [Alicyclobacillus vulcanalis]|nr:hypothetical protein [Alicyclobacillus vulcanalis]
MREDDDQDVKLREWYRNRESVPFRNELKERVLRQASGVRPARTTRRRLLSTAGLWAASAAVALLCLVAGWPRPPMDTVQNAHVTSRGVNQGLVREVVHGFGLAYAPVEVTHVHIGTLPGEPENSCVIATLRNTSQRTLYEPELMGVLWFTEAGGRENWLTFVNAPAQGLKPGQTVTWGFHPSGPHAAGSQALIEIPHVRFFYSRSVSPEAANLVWKEAPVAVEDIQVLPAPGGQGPSWQSADVYATLVNQASYPIHLADERAVIWFSESASGTFFDPTSVRFLFHVTPELPGVSWPTVLQPKERVRVEFRVLSEKGTDFFSRTCHVTLLDAPLVPEA